MRYIFTSSFFLYMIANSFLAKLFISQLPPIAPQYIVLLNSCSWTYLLRHCSGHIRYQRTHTHTHTQRCRLCWQHWPSRALSSQQHPSISRSTVTANETSAPYGRTTLICGSSANISSGATVECRDGIYVLYVYIAHIFCNTCNSYIYNYSRKCMQYIYRN